MKINHMICPNASKYLSGLYPVYQIVNRLESKPYVGCILKLGKTIEQRFKEHCRGHGALYLTAAIKKYGKENFTIELLDGGNTPEQSLELEKYWIKRLSSRAPNGYNLTDGGDWVLGFVFSSESRQRMSRARIGEKNNFYGKHHNAETLARIGESSKNRQQTEETRRKKSEALKGQHRSTEICKKISDSQRGKHHSIETRAKMSESKRGKKFSESHCQKIGNALRGRYKSEETRDRMRKAWVKRKRA